MSNEIVSFKNFVLKHALVKYVQLNVGSIHNISWIKLYGIYHLLKHVFDIVVNSGYYFKYTVKKIPYIKNKIQAKRNEIISDLKTEFDNQTNHIVAYDYLKDNGTSSTDIISLFKKMEKSGTIDYKNGYVSGATYSNNNDLDILLNTLFPYFNKSNPLHTNMYPCVRKMEKECISVMIQLFNGDENTCGIFTSGGTESILMACKTYRDHSKKTTNIVNPEIIVSSSVHCAFTKACSYFNIKMVVIPCRQDGLYNLELLEASINKNTILIVGSTPSYNLGLIDQLNELNKIALNNKIPLHLDACIGSFLINFSDYNFGFMLDGVTSISADFHKYGNSPKGASSILYKNKELMKYQYFIDETWSGGIYASSAMAGSRCGNIVALTWATLMYYGKSKYIENYNSIITIKNHLVKKINLIDDVFVYGKPKLSIVAIGSKTLNINIISDELKKKKWEINVIQNPNGFHFCITSYHTLKIIDKFIIDLIDVIKYIKTHNMDSIKYSPCIYGTMSKINDSDIMTDVISDYLHVVNGAI